MRFFGTISTPGDKPRTRTFRMRAADDLETEVRGWNVGARVVITAEGDMDVVRVYATGGSNNAGNDSLIVELRELSERR